jgi:hypothetical protein
MAFGLRIAQGHDFSVRAANALGVALAEDLAAGRCD